MTGKSKSLLTTMAMVPAIGLGLILPNQATAHCDTLDGAVVADARTALSQGEVTPVLKWVNPGHEKEIREAFAEAMAVRRLNPEAENLADRYFFETLARLLRAGEGAPYTGLKPAGETVDAGRENVAAYVQYVHYLEGIAQAVHTSSPHAEANPADSHRH